MVNLLKENSHIHLIGIGGVSMSGIAEILYQRGYKVSGSDLNNSKYLDLLSERDIDIYLNHKKENIKGADLIVKTSAIPEDNPEITAAKQKDIKIIERAEMLAYLMRNKKTIAVAGTHGKTTTTAILAAIMTAAGKDPAIMVGGYLEDIKGNISDGEGEYFITEADESDGSFLYFDPYLLLLSNLELDHPDYYKDLAEFKAIFKRFADKNDKKALILYNGDDENLANLFKNRKKARTFSLLNGDYQVKNIQYHKNKSSFDFYKEDDFLLKINLTLAGEYNIYNAAAAAAAALELGVEEKFIKKALANFKGVGRRFELKGKINAGTVDVVDDYAHHPTEIKALLKSVKQMGYSRVTAVFQPHRFSRTKKFLNEFSFSFKDADFVYLTDIFSASEQKKENISLQKFREQIEKNSKTEVKYLTDFDEIAAQIKENLQAGEIIITIGAGDVNEICDKVID
ncbi:UDP-N-acetylmuramate--L-alanine ligase [Halanaerobium sp. Z-7514]|uniref:UDP-N-acetylmuramate--L-alanine ligase n=1 Tax=Halanaerobium polyolivorans TaxID=2886943 RepID=A0AAW4WYN1_9FIRM|nr:UDP-N-acetylmuramate--L-alanine ligase [Halanaerobium polyolivorans]